MGGDAQKEAAGMDELQLGDLVQMRKTHPCGSDKWTVIRVGADIKIRCSGCGRRNAGARHAYRRADAYGAGR